MLFKTLGKIQKSQLSLSTSGEDLHRTLCKKSPGAKILDKHLTVPTARERGTAPRHNSPWWIQGRGSPERNELIKLRGRCNVGSLRSDQGNRALLEGPSVGLAACTPQQQLLQFQCEVPSTGSYIWTLGQQLAVLFVRGYGTFRSWGLARESGLPGHRTWIV